MLKNQADRRLPWLALATALLPVIAVNVCYQLSTAAEFIPRCVTYLDGCTSISATGRHGVAYWVFKILMLPQCLLLVVFWRMLAKRLEVRKAWWLRLTYVASAFLAVYVIALGSEGDLYRLMRRYGVFVFFLGTFVTQITITGTRARLAIRPFGWRFQQLLLIVMGFLAIAEVPLGSFGLEDDRAENIIEWNFSLLMQCWFLSWLFLTPGRR
ncbi:MAG: hypothetical protein AAAFM81_01220 [Pseudomonadota bacterium]